MTPGPNNLMLLASGVNYGFARTLPHVLGVILGYVLLLTLLGLGLGQAFVAFPAAHVALKFAGGGYLVWLAWKTAFGPPVDLLRTEPPPRRKLFMHGIGLQLANPNALVYFGGLLPTYFNPDHDMIPQVLVSMATVTVCEMFGLVVYAAGSDALARRFQSQAFARWFFRIAALAMVISACFAVYLTWAATGR